MDEDRSEMEKFLEQIPNEHTPFEQLFEEAKSETLPEKDETGDEVPESVKNRRHRRLEQQLQREREEKIQLKAELDARAKYETRPDHSQSIDNRYIEMYGDTEEGRRAAKIHASLIEDSQKQAEDRAYARFQQEVTATKAEEQRQIQLLDDVAVRLEDEHGIDLTSNAPAARKANRDYFSLLEKMSPKDSQGNVSEFADFEAVFEIFQTQRAKPENTRQKDIADRSMVKSGPVSLAKVETDESEAWLRRNGII